MTEENSGLCIGGPKDGQWIKSENRAFQTYSVLGQVVPHSWGQSTTATVQAQVETYVFYPYYDATEPEPIGFWMHERTRPQDLFKYLVEGYRSGMPRP